MSRGRHPIPIPSIQQVRDRVDYAAAPAAATPPACPVGGGSAAVTTASNSAARSPVPRLSRGPNY